jgi:hypothetical protein
VDAATANAIRRIIASHELEQKARNILGRYASEALDALRPLRNCGRKMALCRVVSRLFHS